MVYKYYHSKKIIRSELINKIENKRKRINYLIEKRRLEKSSLIQCSFILMKLLCTKITSNIKF